MRSGKSMEKKLKFDFYDAAEDAMNEIESEEDMSAEYMENEEIEQEYEIQDGYGIETKGMLLKRISDYLTNKLCCSNNCCSGWKKDDLIKHTQDMEKLSTMEKKLMLLTILRNGAMVSESAR